MIGPSRAPEAAGAAGGREVAIAFGTRVWVYAAGLATQSMLAWLLLPEGRGAYAICVAFSYMLGIAVALSADMGAQYFSVSARIDVSRALSAALGVCLAGSAVAAVVALPLIDSGLPFFQKADAGSFRLALVLVLTSSASLTVDLVLSGLRRFTPLLAIFAAQSVVTVAGVALLVRGLGLGVDGALLALVAGHVVLFAGGLLDLRQNFGLSLAAPSLAQCRQVVGYGLQHHTTRIGTEIEPFLGVIALGTVAAGRADIGLFAAATAILFRITLIADAVRMVLYPRIVDSEGRNLETFGLCLRLVCAASAGATLLLLAIATPLVRILLSEAFILAVPLMTMAAPGVVAAAAARLFVAYFNGIGRPGLCSWSVWVGLSANLGSFAVLYPVLGAAGAACALSVGTTARAIWLGVQFHRVSGARAPSIWSPRRSDFLYLRASGRTLFAGGGCRNDPARVSALPPGAPRRSAGR